MPPGATRSSGHYLGSLGGTLLTARRCAFQGLPWFLLSHGDLPFFARRYTSSVATVGLAPPNQVFTPQTP